MAGGYDDADDADVTVEKASLLLADRAKVAAVCQIFSLPDVAWILFTLGAVVVVVVVVDDVAT